MYLPELSLEARMMGAEIEILWTYNIMSNTDTQANMLEKMEGPR